MFTTIIIFFAAELLTRLTRCHTDLWAATGRATGRNPIEKWAIVDAFSAYKGRPGRYGKKTINKYGFISTPRISIEKPKSTIRLVFLGGSSTAGTGHDLADKDTWPFLVTKKLQLAFPDRTFDYINGALGGYSSFESYGRLWSRIRFFSPDIIVVYHGWNEMYYFNNGYNILSWRTLPDDSWGFQSSPKVATYQPYWFDFPIRYSQLLTKVRLRISKAMTGELSVSKKLIRSYDRRGPGYFRTNLRLIKHAASVFDAELFVAKQATLIVPNLDEYDRKRCHYEYHGFDHDAHVEAFDQIYRIIEEEIDDRHIIDTTLLSGVSEYFYDHIHPTERGAKKISQIVSQSLKVSLAQGERCTEEEAEDVARSH